MREHRTRHRAALRLRARGKRGGEIGERGASMGAIDRIGKPPERRSAATNDAHRQQRYDGRHYTYGRELESANQCRRPISHDSKSTAGSIDTVIGSTAASMSQ